MDEGIAEDAAESIEDIQGVRNVKIIYDKDRMLPDTSIEEPAEETKKRTWQIRYGLVSG